VGKWSEEKEKVRKKEKEKVRKKENETDPIFAEGSCLDVDSSVMSLGIVH
jgi:hypothetical protein